MGVPVTGGASRILSRCLRSSMPCSRLVTVAFDDRHMGMMLGGFSRTSGGLRLRIWALDGRHKATAIHEESF
jgi:hypothetical protein